MLQINHRPNLAITTNQRKWKRTENETISSKTRHRVDGGVAEDVTINKLQWFKCVPDILKDLECALNSVNDMMSDIDNFHLRNAFLYRKRLDYAFDVFCMEKELGNVTFRSFEGWVQARTKVGKRRAYSLQNLAKSIFSLEIIDS